MSRTGSSGDQMYVERNRQIQQNLLVEERQQEQNQRQMEVPMNEIIQQNQRKPITQYDRFYQRLKPLPPVPVAQGPVPQEAKVGYKERKRREKQVKKDYSRYKEINSDLSKNPRLLDEEEVRELPLFKTKQGREKWAGEKLSHSSSTREETMRQVLDKGDYSNFENLDHLMRNMIASKALAKFIRDYDITANSDPKVVCGQIQERTRGVSGLLDPALRLALSLAQRTDGIAPEMQNFYRELDEAMSTAVMVSTLTHVADKTAVVKYFTDKGSENADWDADQAIDANKAQQIQIAKRLLLMQLSNFQKITKGANGEANGTPWDKSMAVALSHCSRVMLTLPRQDGNFSNAHQQKEMWRSILTTGGENAAQDNSRASSTHSLERRKVSDHARIGSKEKKVLFNLVGQRGMNCAIGGLGNAGISGNTLCNDGTSGHFYSMYQEADADHYGAMLMGIESDAAGVTNQMGHTHDWKATAEKASSLGGQRTDEVGEKYGGRQCDLSDMSARDIQTWMDRLERAMTGWQSGRNGMQHYEAKQVMELLAGKKLDASGWTTLRIILGIPANVSSGNRPN